MAYDNDYDRFNFDEKVIVIVNGHSIEKIFKIIKTNNISDSKRQQTTTVDNKRLFNGLVLIDDVSLRRENIKTSSLWKYRNMSKASQQRKERV